MGGSHLAVEHSNIDTRASPGYNCGRICPEISRRRKSQCPEEGLQYAMVPKIEKHKLLADGLEPDKLSIMYKKVFRFTLTTMFFLILWIIRIPHWRRFRHNT